MKKVLTAVLDTEYDAEFITIDDHRVFVPIRTTRILEVENHDTPAARRKPEGNDRSFLWRFNNYCSFEQRQEGTYMQCESVSLSRGLPFLVGQIVKPFVTGIPRETMTFTLSAARRHLTENASSPERQTLGAIGLLDPARPHPLGFHPDILKPLGHNPRFPLSRRANLCFMLFAFR